MKVMQFLPKLRLFLKENGAIYTVRRYEMKEEIVKVETVGECRRIPLGVVHKEDLEPYASMSGFHNLADWWEMINRFCSDNKSPKYLYRVEKIDRGIK